WLKGASGSSLRRRVCRSRRDEACRPGPSGPTVPVGGTQQFTATGTYSDSSTQNVTNQGTFASSSPGGAAGTAGSFTIWPSNPVPAIVDGGAPGEVELGVKFQSDVAGTIIGIRFYKSAANTGTHLGNLWTTAGAKLGTGTFTGETASGWQQMTFATPVAIQANTVYVASYYAPNGHYSANLDYFTTQGVDTPPLHALANGVSGGNGVYAYGAASSLPTNTFRAQNYWVDVLFTPAPSSTTTSSTTTSSTTSSTSSTTTSTTTSTTSSTTSSTTTSSTTTSTTSSTTSSTTTSTTTTSSTTSTTSTTSSI